MCLIFVKISFIYLKISLFVLYFVKFNQNVFDFRENFIIFCEI